MYNKRHNLALLTTTHYTSISNNNIQVVFFTVQVSIMIYFLLMTIIYTSVALI